MAAYAKEITALINTQPENRILKASALYESSGISAPLETYYKVLERKAKSGELVHLTKGLYYRPHRSRFGIVPISENEIARYYMSDNHGALIGYRMYNQKGLTTQVGKEMEILSNNLSENRKHIRNILVQRINIMFTSERIGAIEALEILQSLNKIEDLNRAAFAEYMNFYIKNYSDSAMVFVLEHRKYKKSTIAFLEKILSDRNVKNSLKKYLSPMSEYKIPEVKELYETT